MSDDVLQHGACGLRHWSKAAGVVENTRHILIGLDLVDGGCADIAIHGDLRAERWNEENVAW